MLALGSASGLWQESLCSICFVFFPQLLWLPEVSWIQAQLDRLRRIAVTDVLVFVVDGNDEFDEVPRLKSTHLWSSHFSFCGVGGMAWLHFRSHHAFIQKDHKAINTKTIWLCNLGCVQAFLQQGCFCYPGRSPCGHFSEQGAQHESQTNHKPISSDDLSQWHVSFFSWNSSSPGLSNM